MWKCSRVCGITDSSAATTSSDRRRCRGPPPACCARSARGPARRRTRAPAPSAQRQVREAEVDRDPRAFSSFEAVGVGAGQRAGRARSCRGRCGPAVPTTKERATRSARMASAPSLAVEPLLERGVRDLGFARSAAAAARAAAASPGQQLRESDAAPPGRRPATGAAATRTAGRPRRKSRAPAKGRARPGWGRSRAASRPAPRPALGDALAHPGTAAEQQQRDRAQGRARQRLSAGGRTSGWTVRRRP